MESIRPEDCRSHVRVEAIVDHAVVRLSLALIADG